VIPPDRPKGKRGPPRKGFVKMLLSVRPDQAALLRAVARGRAAPGCRANMSAVVREVLESALATKAQEG
jgi:hypothetical protein